MRGFSGDAIRRLRANPAAVLALSVICTVVVATLLGPWLNPNNTETLDWLHVAARPGLQNAHWFGTDRLGRDLYARTLAGTRVSIASGLPLIFFVIFLTVIFGRSESLLFISIGAVGWLTMARIVRGQTLSIRRQDYIAAAVASGASSSRIIARHVVPNVIGPVIVYATLTVPQIILFESFLSFLGLGIQEPGASLGTLIAEGVGEMEAAPWMLLVPGSFLAVLLLCLNIFGDGLRDALDVREG